jgi:hypothetical protein
MTIPRRRRWRFAAAVLALGLPVALGLVWLRGGEGTFDLVPAGDRPATLRYEIPAGAGEAIDRGERLEILPQRLEVHVGDVIEIVNHDDRGHLIGPFFVGAGATVRQRFATRGEYRGTCSVHPSGTIVIVVR